MFKNTKNVLKYVSFVFVSVAYMLLCTSCGKHEASAGAVGAGAGAVVGAEVSGKKNKGLGALVGAITGTLLPQILGFGDNLNMGLLEGITVAVLTVCTLLTFYFTGKKTEDGEWKRPLWLRGIAPIGQTVLMITFGFLFATIISTSLVILTQRIDFYFTELMRLLS